MAEQSLAWYIGHLARAIAEAQQGEGWGHDEARWRTGDRESGAARVSVRRRPSGDLVAVLQYAAGDEPITDAIPLVSTPCNFGGVRWWWLCPGCGRRCGVLFNPRRLWRCRHCHNIIYESSCDSHRWDRLWRDMGFGPEAGNMLRRRWRRVAH